MGSGGRENIVAKEVHTVRESGPSTNEVTVNLYHGDELVAKSEPVAGSIARICLNSTGDKILYATDKWLIMLFDVETKTTRTLLKLESAPSIIGFVTAAGFTSIVCGENDNLKVNPSNNCQKWDNHKFFNLQNLIKFSTKFQEKNILEICVFFSAIN